MTYVLHVMFKSNEHPWSSNYAPDARYQPRDDDEAVRWASGMADGLGSSYQCTLSKDGRKIELRRMLGGS